MLRILHGKIGTIFACVH